MRVLIAGGAGFVGSFLTQRFLQRGDQVVVLDNLSTGRRENLALAGASSAPGRLEFVLGDATCPPDLTGRFDAVLHLASPASPIDYFRLPIETLECGSTATRELLEVARRHHARFLLASTSEVYGDPEIHPQTEDYWGRVNPVGPRSVYDEAKRFAEALTTAFMRRHGVEARIARIFNTYGPRMRPGDGRIIPTFVRQALLGEPIPIHGDGCQTRSYCHVSDLVEGLLLLLESDVEGPVNLGNPEEHSVMETALLVLAATRSRSNLLHLPAMEDDPRQRRPDIARAQRDLAWRPRIRFAEGLRDTVVDLQRRLHDETPGEERTALGS